MRTSAVIVLTLAASFAFADYRPTGIRWHGWEVTTSENLFWGRTHRSYPLTNLLDGDPRTAWVYSGPRKHPPGEEPRDRYAIEVLPSKSVTLDGLRIMNGYNKSDRTFANNRRVVKLTVFAADDWEKKRPLKVAHLPDRPGWHSIPLPRRKYASGIRIVLNQFAGGKEQDIALSELQLTNRGRRIAMGMPRAVLATEGSSCGCGTIWSAVTRKGEVIASSNWGELNGSSIDPRGRYAAGVQRRDGIDGRVWVVDLRKGRLVRSRPIRSKSDLETWWKGRTLSVGSAAVAPVKEIRL